MKPAALVTGASSGIGEALALCLAAEGEQLVLTGRSSRELQRVAAAVEAASGKAALCITADLAEPGAAEHLRTQVSEAGLRVRDLINNAGFGLAGDMADLPRAGQLGIVDVNCRALLDLTLTFMPDIRATRGGVLNVASVAAFTPGPGLAVYYASKAFVLSFSRALRHELAPDGVRVSCLCPGPTATRFGERAGFGGSRAVSMAVGLDAMGVARVGLSGFRANRAVIVPGWTNKLLVFALGVLPVGAVLPVLSRIQRRRRMALPSGGA